MPDLKERFRRPEPLSCETSCKPGKARWMRRGGGPSVAAELGQFEQPGTLPGYNDKPSAGLDLAGRYYNVSGYSLTLRHDINDQTSLRVLACLLNSEPSSGFSKSGWLCNEDS